MTLRPMISKIELKNKGQLSFFFIGSGSAFSKTNYQTNLLVIKGNTHVLIDCGTICSYVMSKDYNSKISDIKNLILTHPHADHIGGVEEMAFIGKYVSKEPVNIIIPKKFKKKLWKESLKGGIQFSEKGRMHFEDYFNLIDIKKVQNKPFEMYEAQIGGLNFKLFRTRHVTTSKTSLRNSQLSYGVLIDDRVLFTGDTQFNEFQLRWLLDKYKGIEVIFHDCDISGYSTGVHASYYQLCTMPEAIRSKMYLCHYSEDVNNIDAIVDGFGGLVHHGVYYDF